MSGEGLSLNEPELKTKRKPSRTKRSTKVSSLNEPNTKGLSLNEPEIPETKSLSLNDPEVKTKRNPTRKPKNSLNDPSSRLRKPRTKH
jgi:hypothetical protein